MARRGRRDLSLEEKRLWEHVARHVTPLARPGIPIETPGFQDGPPSKRAGRREGSREGRRGGHAEESPAQ